MTRLEKVTEIFKILDKDRDGKIANVVACLNAMIYESDDAKTVFNNKDGYADPNLDDVLEFLGNVK